MDGVVQHFEYGQYVWVSRSVLVKEMGISFVQLFLSSLPTKPEDGKWTLLGPCLDFVMGTSHTCRLFGLLFELSLAKLQADAPRFEIPECSDSLTWHEVRGVRAKLGSKYVKQPQFLNQLTTLSLATEGIRYLTAWSLTKSKDFPDPCEFSPIFDLTLVRANPGLVVAEYLASLADGTARRLILLFRPSGYSDFAAWHDNRSDEASYSRAVFLNCAAWVNRRWLFKYGKYSVHSPFLSANPHATGLVVVKGGLHIYIYIHKCFSLCPYSCNSFSFC